MKNTMRSVLLYVVILLVLSVANGEEYANDMYNKSNAEYFIESISEKDKMNIVRSIISENDEIILAKMLWGEDRENPMYMRAAIIWCVFNRMDRSSNSIEALITPEQFPGYMVTNPVKDWAIDIIRDVTLRYALEKNGFEDVGRVLPTRFIYYEMPIGKRYHVFKTKLSISDPDNENWDWSLKSPYDK